jgi:hypothetical protein
MAFNQCNNKLSTQTSQFLAASQPHTIINQ